MILLQKCQILDSHSVTVGHLFRWILSPLPQVTMQIVTYSFLDQRPQKQILHILYNQYVTDAN